MAFELKKPNPIYSINTKIVKGPNVATEQIGDQNVIVDECRPKSKGPYTQTYIPTYSTKNKVSINPKILELNAKYNSFFGKSERNDTPLEQYNEESELFVPERKFTSDLGGLSSFIL